MAATQTRTGPLAAQLLDAVGDERNGAAAAEDFSVAQARRVATKVGRGMLAASDAETAKHSDDVVVISRAICDVLGIKGAERQDLLAAAKLHDIGKAGIPKALLEKAGPLTEEEWTTMRTHTVIGWDILIAVPELRGIAAMVRSSHERWDGRGYPDGLERDEIPLGSRVVFCADAFHAIRSDRPYRAGRSAKEALEEIKAHSGTQFDPDVVDALVRVARELALVPGKGRVRRSSRLTALLMMLAVGVTGSAVAQTGLLDGGDTGSGASAGISQPLVCGPLDCPALLGVSIYDQLGVEPPAGRDATLGSGPGEALVPAPGSGTSEVKGTGTGAPGAATGPGLGERPSVSGPADSAPASSQPQSTEPGKGTPSDGSSTPATGGGTGSAGGGKPGGSKGSGSPHPDHPHGGPPGQTGNHPHGGPPGQTGNHPQGGPPGQSGGSSPGGGGGAPGNSGSSPGKSGGSPGNSGSAPGSSGSAPGNSGGKGKR